MTNNEKVKQSINNNMASIYTALEQVGAPLPERKNLQNVAQAILNIDLDLLIYKCLDLMNTTKATTFSEEDYILAENTLQNLYKTIMGV